MGDGTEIPRFLSEICIIRFDKILFYSDLTSVLYFGPIFCRLNCGITIWYNSFVYGMSCRYFVSDWDSQSRGTVPRDTKSRDFRVTRPGTGTEYPLDSRDRDWYLRDCPAKLVSRDSNPGTKNSRDSRDCPVPIPWLNCIRPVSYTHLTLPTKA